MENGVAVPGRIPREERFRLLVIACIGGVLIFVAGTEGAGEFRWRFLLYFSLVAAGAAVVLQEYLHPPGGERWRPFSRCLSLLVLLLAWLTLSLLWCGSRYNALQQVFLYLSYALSFYLGFRLLRGKRTVKLFMILVNGISLSLCVYGLIQYFFNFSEQAAFLAGMGIDYRLTDRVYSHFINPNLFASFLNLSLPLALALLLTERRKLVRVLWGGILSVQLWALYLTQSRGGWIVFLLAAAALVFLVPRRSWKSAAKVLLLVFLLTALAVYLSSLYHPLTESAGENGGEAYGEEYSGLDVGAAASSMKGRMGIWRGGLAMFADNAVVGVGAGGFGLAMQRYQYRAYYSSHAHNYLLETGAEGGAVALFLMLGITVFLMWRVGEVLRLRKEGWRGIALSAFWVATMGFLLHNLVEFSWYSPLVGCVFWLEAGALFSLPGEEGAPEGSAVVEEGENVPRGGKARAAVVLVSLLLAAAVGLAAWFSILHFLAETYSEKGDEDAVFATEETAVEDYLHSLDFVETDPSTHKILGDLYRGLYVEGKAAGSGGEYAALSLRHYDRAIELEPDDAYKHQEKGVLLLFMGDHQAGRACLEEARRLYPHNPAPSFNLGQSYMEEGDTERAREEYQKALDLLPYYADPDIVPFRKRGGLDIILTSLARVAEIWVREGKPENALAEIDRALQELPRKPFLYLLRGWVNEQAGNYEEALEDYEQVLQLNPEAGGVHLAMGRILKAMGEYDEARDQFEQELEVNPCSEEAREELEALQEETSG